MEESSNLRLLAVFAHPDDESFGAGGTLARYAAEGVEVHLVCATRGEDGSVGEPPLCTQEELGALREQELRVACSVLGVRTLRFLDCVDGRMDACPQRAVVGEVVAAIRGLRPQVVITFGPDGISGHPDHIAIGRAATEAVVAAADPTAYPEQLAAGLQPWAVGKLYYLARSRSTAITCEGAGTEADEALATVRIDAAGQIGAKLKAMRSHRSQCQAFDEIPEPELRERVRYECFKRAIPAIKGSMDNEAGLFDGIAHLTPAKR
ncbi:MAG: PIG-L family deacetylase [Chloroflexi bacterium]|nr:PIG-L family deacetylase [Chloroflexota bacterium]